MKNAKLYDTVWGHSVDQGGGNTTTGLWLHKRSRGVLAYGSNPPLSLWGISTKELVPASLGGVHTYRPSSVVDTEKAAPLALLLYAACLSGGIQHTCRAPL